MTDSASRLTPEPLPCPFCGGPADVVVYSSLDPDFKRYFKRYGCIKSTCAGGIAVPLEQWNLRSARGQSPKDGVIYETRKLLRELRPYVELSDEERPRYGVFERQLLARIDAYLAAAKEPPAVS